MRSIYIWEGYLSGLGQTAVSSAGEPMEGSRANYYIHERCLQYLWGNEKDLSTIGAILGFTTLILPGVAPD
ncbi:MAG: hypothetical protein GF372_10225 [Candidatus Marinimicrobia bacterium]|nr:hypothetical protein [Candidatus Neomarinimicrobiota bacterium]